MPKTIEMSVTFSFTTFEAFQGAIAAGWGENTGEMLFDIREAFVITGVNGNVIETFSQQIQQYTQASLRHDGEAQRQILRRIAEGFSRAHFEQARLRFAASARDALASLITLPPDDKLMQILGDFSNEYTLRLRLFHLRAKKALTDNAGLLEFLKHCGVERLETQADALQKRLETLADPAKLKNKLHEKLEEIQKIERDIEALDAKALDRKGPPAVSEKRASPSREKPKARVETPPPIPQPPISQLIRELFASDNLPADLLEVPTTEAKWKIVEQKVRDMSKTHYLAGTFFNRVLREGKLNRCLTPEEAWALLEKCEKALSEGRRNELGFSFERIVYYRALTIRGRGLIKDINEMLPGLTEREQPVVRQLRDALSATLKTEEIRDIRTAVIKLESAIRNSEGKKTVFVDGHWKFSRFSN